MITFAICEDEAYFVLELKRLLTMYSNERKAAISIQSFASGEEFLQSSYTADILLMDIRLPGKDGMNIIQYLREQENNSQVIFTTSYQNYVFQAFDLDAVHYLLKPITAKKLFPAVDKAVKRLKVKDEQTLLIKNGAMTTKLPIKDILYCEALNHQITVHSRTGQFKFWGTLDAVEQHLDNRFFRCHKSYIVNMRFVVSRNADTAVMEGGDKVLISRRRQQEFIHRLLEIYREE